MAPRLGEKSDDSKGQIEMKKGSKNAKSFDPTKQANEQRLEM